MTDKKDNKTDKTSTDSTNKDYEPSRRKNLTIITDQPLPVVW